MFIPNRLEVLVVFAHLELNNILFLLIIGAFVERRMLLFFYDKQISGFGNN